jgi:hypothetical protein
MFIGKVHFAAEQLKETRWADIDASGSIASYAFLPIEANVRCFINFETHEI